MRQCGLIAAAGLVALTTMVDRLKEDHDNAALFSQLISDMPGLTITHQVQTNIVIMRLNHASMNTDVLKQHLRKKRILASALDSRRLRVVFNRHITKENTEFVAAALREILEEHS